VPILAPRRRVELAELHRPLDPTVGREVLNTIRHLHDSGLVAAPVAVVGRGEDGHDLVIVLPLVALHHKLVSARDVRQIVDVRELFRDVLAERVAGAAGAARGVSTHASVVHVCVWGGGAKGRTAQRSAARFEPLARVGTGAVGMALCDLAARASESRQIALFSTINKGMVWARGMRVWLCAWGSPNSPATPVIRITPDQIAHGPLMRHLLDAVELPGVVESVNGGGEAAVEAEDLVGDDGGHGKVVEGVGEVLPHVGVAVLAQALVVEAVDLRGAKGGGVSARLEDPWRSAGAASPARLCGSPHQARPRRRAGGQKRGAPSEQQRLRSCSRLRRHHSNRRRRTQHAPA